MFIFAIIPYFIWVILSKKCCQKRTVEKKDKKVRWSYRAGWGEGCIWNKGWFKPAHYDPLPEQHIPTYYQEMKQ